MTDENQPQPYDDEAEQTALPTIVRVSTEFSARLPSQRVLDQLSRIEGANFGELAQAQPFRIVAFRALLRDFPSYDTTALWLHAYDVEVEVEDANPTNGKSQTPVLRSADTGG
jgi:hypothetical protein